MIKKKSYLFCFQFNWRIYYERMNKECEMLRRSCDDKSRRPHGVRASFDIDDTDTVLDEPCIVNVVNAMTDAFATWTLSSDELCLQLTSQLAQIEDSRLAELDKTVKKATVCFSN